MEKDRKQLLEYLAKTAQSSEQYKELEVLLETLLSVYATSGAKGVAQHIKDEVEIRQTRALQALQEVQERL